jgi:T-complex protein 11
LYTALSPLLPEGHTVLITFSSPLSPTSSPLLSAIAHLRETLSSLRQRCAPARDAHLDNLLHNLDNIPPATSTHELAKIVVETVRSILSLADTMKDDLSNFVLGSMTERQLRHIVAEQAMSLERSLVLDLWNLERIQELWTNWARDPAHVDLALLEKTPLVRKWVFKLMRTLCSAVPVFCPLPTMSPPMDSTRADITPIAPGNNLLPPPLFFLTPTLLYLQNYLQALVIAASLQSLVPRTPNNSPPQSSEHQYTFMSRVWALLKAEIDGEPGSGETKVINLADEVVHAHRITVGGARADTEEQRLRSAVERILHTSDPVFILLQQRLSTALLSKLVFDASEAPQPRSAIPDRLRSGTAGDGHIHLNLSQDEEDVDIQVDEVAVKGFEDPVLKEAVRASATQLKRCIHWTIGIWSDLIEQCS